ncbi:MAG TPA: hypothetical protein VLX91_02010 [Candidatus Acidoferrales bacterium]|nr:hypothetical protein [Candidatus Acidoferrales bacterium]
MNKLKARSLTVVYEAITEEDDKQKFEVNKAFDLLFEETLKENDFPFKGYNRPKLALTTLGSMEYDGISGIHDQKGGGRISESPSEDV